MNFIRTYKLSSSSVELVSHLPRRLRPEFSVCSSSSLASVWPQLKLTP